MQMHWETVEEIKRLPEVSAGGRPRPVGQGAGARPAARLPQRPGHGAGPHRHDQLHDGLRHDGHRARHRAGEVQATGRRRHAEDRQPDGAAGPADAGLRPAADRVDPGLHRRARHDRRRAGLEARAPAGVRLRLPAAQRHALDRLAGPHPDDGRRPAVPLRRDLEDGEHAPRDARRTTSPTPTSKAGGWG